MRAPWLIWSNEHNAYWGHGEIGYVKSPLNAGRYTTGRAIVIVARANEHIGSEKLPNEIMVPSPETVAAVDDGFSLTQFHNALRILMNIDKAEFDATLDPQDRERFSKMETAWSDRMWVRFRDHPHQYFIECCQSQTDKLFAIIKERNR